MTDNEEKINHVRLMASGEIMTCLGPADRAGLKQVLEELDHVRLVKKNLLELNHDDLRTYHKYRTELLVEAEKLCAQLKVGAELEHFEYGFRADCKKAIKDFRNYIEWGIRNEDSRDRETKEETRG